MDNRVYAAIDLKSFYASVECVERGLNPLTTNLVVADASRTEKTICLAVSPSLKAYGIPGRARLFEVVQTVRRVNAARKQRAPGRAFTGSSCDELELAASPALSLDYITATPQMAHYIECSAQIYNIYLKYIAPEDIHVYSIDEVFMDITDYLATYKLKARELVTKIILDVLDTTGISASAGLGTNLYLAKVAMDIGAKHIPADKNGVRIAWLDEMKYRRTLWTHRPLRDFWRIGAGYAKKLEAHGMYTMGDVARCSTGRPGDYLNEKLLYDLFGVNAELLIDHAWGWEPCRIADIKAFQPEASSVGVGQVLKKPLAFDKARDAVRAMVESLVLGLVKDGRVTNQIVLTVGYDKDNLAGPAGKSYAGEVTTDNYGRKTPKHAHGTANLGGYTASSGQIVEAVLQLFDSIVNRNLSARRLHVTANDVIDEEQAAEAPQQLNLFTDYAAAQEKKAEDEAKRMREKKRQKAILEIQQKYGKNAILKGADFEEDSVTQERNDMIGGHKA